MTTVRLEERRLSDGSGVWAVTIIKDGYHMHLDCITVRDAEALYGKLCDAVEAHTNEFVDAD